MVSARAVSLFAFGIASGVLTGCEEVIGLGEEPPLRKTAEICSLPPAKNPACTECMVDTCCEQSRACAANAACANAAHDCLPTCWEGTCAFRCLEPLEGEARSLLFSLISCGAPCQTTCLPTRDGLCEALAKECCDTIEGLEERQVCTDTALGGDEEACRSFHLQATSSLCPPS